MYHSSCRFKAALVGSGDEEEEERDLKVMSCQWWDTACTLSLDGRGWKDTSWF